LLNRELKLKTLVVNGKSLPFTQRGRYASAPMAFGGTAFSHSQELPLRSTSDGSFTGAFTLPSRIKAQLERRRELWPIPWTQEDYATTWLVPERLLLFLQMVEPSDAMLVQANIDGSPITLSRAYASVREDSQCFVGWYADLSKLAVDTPHTVQLALPPMERSHFQGLFFDNIEGEYTEQLAQ
jgi:hypothetical protein